MVEFDIQRYLESIEKVRREDHAALVKEVQEGFQSVGERMNSQALQLTNHEKDDIETNLAVIGRLKGLEDLQGTLRWVFRAAVGTVIVGVAGLLFDLLKNHWH